MTRGRKKTHEEFVDAIENSFPCSYIFHSQYIGCNSKIDVEHIVCGYRWMVNPNNLLQRKSKCPQCNGKHNKSAEEFCDYVKLKTKGEFSSLGDFKGNNHLTTFVHNKCGYTFKAYPLHVRTGEIGCRKCSNMLIHDKERVELLLEEKYGTEYILLSNKVKNNRDNITVKHDTCNQQFETTSSRLIGSGVGCPYCKPLGSKGELKIENILKQNKMNFIREYTFDDCRHKNVLFFDFAIFDSNGNLLSLIEFDGKQHFEPIDFFGGIEGFEISKIRDGIKNDYCKKRNIPLLRIPYWDEVNIDEIIRNYLLNSKQNKVVVRK